MNVKPFGNQKKWIILLALILGLFLCGISALFFGKHLLSQQIQQNQSELHALLKQELGYPVDYEEIQASIEGYRWGILLKNVVIYNEKTEEPLLSVEALKILPNVWTLLWNKTIKPEKIILNQLKLVILWDKKNKITIQGLKQKNAKTAATNTLNDSEWFSLLSKLQSISIEEGEILWQGPTLAIKQYINGQFQWMSDHQAFKISGSHQLQIREGEWLPESDFSLEINQGKEQTIDKIKVDIKGKRLRGQCEFNSNRVQEKTMWGSDCTANLKDQEIAAVHNYYKPDKEDLPLLQWLTEALISGKIKEGQLKIKGPVQDLQWEGHVDYDDVTFKYAPNWPKIEYAKGTVLIATDKVTVQLAEGSIMENDIDSATAVIEPIQSKEFPIVKVAGTLDSTLENGLVFLQNSPLKQSIAEPLESFQPKGNMHLILDLSIPLSENLSNTIQGTLSTEDGHLDLPGIRSEILSSIEPEAEPESEEPTAELDSETKSELKKLVGTFHFTEQSLEASNVTGEWMGHPLSLTIETLKDKQNRLKISAKGTFDSDFLQEHWDIPLMDKFEGETEMDVSLNVPLNRLTFSASEWSIHSNLVGMAIHLPKPIAKEAAAEVPLTITLVETHPLERKIAIHLDKQLDMKVVVRKENQKLKLKNGHVVLGETKSIWKTDEILLIEGMAESLNAEEWLGVIYSEEKPTLPVMDLRLWVKHLQAYGLQFKNTWIMTDTFPKDDSLERSIVEWRLDGPKIKGRIVLPSEKEAPFIIDLNYLKLVAGDVEPDTATEFLQNKEKSPIRFFCDDLQYEQSHFGKSRFSLAPTSFGYEIQNLSLASTMGELIGAGEWHLGTDGSHTTLQGEIASNHMGELLLRWGYPSMIRESRGTIQYRFEWPNTPFQFNLATVKGSAYIKLKQGRILGVNPGLGRVLGLLDLENIRRRLQLDFSDVFKKGFVFDDMKGSFDFRQGITETSELLINGPSAKIELAGTANLKDKTIDLTMSVTPQVGVGIPLAAAAIVTGANPVLGAGLWALDKLTGSQINRITGSITKNRYRVTGTLDAPHIQEIGGRK